MGRSLDLLRILNTAIIISTTKTVNSAAPATYIGGTSVTAGIQDHPASGGTLSVGANALLAASNSGKDRVIGVAVFSDGSRLVILDKTI